jgi:CNT family concentrative nucleoside transporter/purine nucleoside transport protein
MLFAVNVAGIFIFLGIAIFFSKDRAKINKKTVLTLLVLNLIIAAFFTSFSIGREIIVETSHILNKIIAISYEGAAFAIPNWVNVPQMNFITAALFPLLMIVPLMDMLTYFGILPAIIGIVGKILHCIAKLPKFESFYSIEMTVLGMTEAIPISRFQLQQMSSTRCLTNAMMSMSCISAAMVGSYTQMMPEEYILTAIPLNIINALIITHILNPLEITPEEDFIVKIEDENKPSFFAFLGNSIINAGKLIFIITVMVMAFVSLAKLINAALALISPAISLESILGLIMFPFAFLLGLDVSEALQVGEFMGLKLITNEFVAMLSVQPLIPNFSEHIKAVLTVFLTSFANLGSVGIIIGLFQGIVSAEKLEYISQNLKYVLISGILVSLMSAAIAGLFVW